MESIKFILNNSLVDAIGWTIVHSIWQISLWAILAVTLLILTHKRKANIRYLLLSATLLGISTTSVITFKNHYPKEKIVTTSTTIHKRPITDNSRQNIVSPETPVASENTIAVHWKVLDWFNNYFEAHLPGVASIWFLGFVFLILRYLGSIAWLIRLKALSEIESDDFHGLIYKLSRKIKLKRIVDIGRTDKLNSPVVIGHFKPVILLPAKLFTGLSDDQLESILLHELAHVKRDDFLVNLIQSFIEVIFFYHPAIWWLAASIRTEREHACDDLALKGGANAKSLAQTLAGLAEILSPTPNLSQAFSGKQHKIKNRIHRLILTEKMKTNLIQKVIVVAVIIVSVAALSFSNEKNVSKKDTPNTLMRSDSTSTSKKVVQSEETKFEKPLKKPKLEKVKPAKAVKLPKQKPAKVIKDKESDLPSVQLQNKVIEDNDDDDESSAEALKSLMKKGAKAWNKYREANPGENFAEALKESNLSGLDLSNFNLSFINLKEATLVNTNFTNANMTGVNIKEADARGTIFEKANLSNSNMKELTLNSINLKKTNLRGANLKEITLINCDLSGADLTGTILHESTIKNCIFKGTIANHTTQFPPDFKWDEQGIVFK